ELPLRDLFAAPTVGQLAQRIQELRASAQEPSAAPPLVAMAPGGPAELSFSQQRLWFLEQMEPGRTTYLIPGAIQLEGTLEVEVLERALGALVNRHAALRTVFEIVEGRPLQRVKAPGPWRLPVIQLGAASQQARELQARLRQELARGFDLERGPLFGAQLYRLSAQRHVLLLLLHHIIADGWSLGILFRELGQLYGQMQGGQAPSLPALALEYGDYARWQRGWLQGQTLEGLLAHWRRRLAGAPQVLELVGDRPRPAVESNRGAVYSFSLPPELAAGLGQLGRQAGATLYMTLLAGFAALLSRYTGQEDLLVGTPVANRGRAETEEIVGCFVNTLVVRANGAGDPTVSQFLDRVREECLEALAHQDLPFERLVEELRPVRDLSRNPVVQVLFALQNAPLPPLQLPGLRQSLLELDPGVAKVDLTLEVQEQAQGLRASFNYATDLFEPPTIQRLATHWRALLQAMVADPQQRLSHLPLLTPAERHQVLVQWNGQTTDYSRELRVHDLFQAQADRTPAVIAVTVADRRLTYEELDRRSNQLAHHLRGLGVGRGQRVGLCVKRSLEMMIGLFGILKAGAAYVPLDPVFPAERLQYMAQDVQMALLLSTRDLAGQFGLPRESQLLLDADAAAIAAAPTTRLPADDHAAQGQDPAYVIYTSGSTGRPKGVVVPHRAVVNFLLSMAGEPGLGASDVLVAVTTLSFDIAVLELQLPLSVGAQVVIATQDQAIDGTALGALLEQHRATVMQATPVTWRLLLEAGWTPRPRFKALVGGESMPKDLADQLIASGVELWNLYGPTETTVWSTCARLTNTQHGISIGKPIANSTVRILDGHGNLCPVGVPGELCIGGDGVSLGYWNRPELTAERFIRDPFDTDAAARLYRTGDLARWHSDGSLEHLGRLDFQIKLRGFRLEPAEIEAALAQHPAVREVTVIGREDTPGDRHLVAYLVVADPPPDLFDQLRARVRGALPEYMVPARFVILKALPRTQNGKLDRRGLPAPGRAEVSPGRVLVTPRTPTERLVLDLFRGVLGRDDLGVRESFFDLGGHSLMAARLMFRLRAATGVDLPMRLLFECPTAAALAEAVERLTWLTTVKAPPPGDAGSREEIEL
ncbi:MAG: amino acid adenylation domain-containing protein, partial [Verrucomicrobia bacterium]|nr:amino acid adenylation domain-containing protein [Verrucomicrobiota bacterium]